MSDLIIRPNGDSSPLELSCSSGTTHYTLIDEAVADDSDYVFYSGTHSAIDYYTFENHTTETGVIAGIIMYARCTGSANIYFRVYISGTEYTIGSAYAGSGWALANSGLLSTNPSTSAAWTWSEIDNLIAGIRINTGEEGILTKCSQLYIAVVLTTIDSFTATSPFILDSPVTLTWATTNATAVSISPTVGSTTVDGTIDLYPTATTTYTLTATGTGVSTTATATATLSEPVIDSFTATPENMEFGKSSVLAWGTTGSASVTLSQGIGIVGVDGTKTVYPTETTSYTLSATNSSGTVYDYVTVTVIPSSNKVGVADIAGPSPDYGRLPQMDISKSYLEFSSDVTEHYVRSLGFSFTGGDFKRPYLSKNYNSMTYLFDDTPSEVSNSLKETQLSKITGNTPDRNAVYFDFSQTLASENNFNAYAAENYRLMGKIPPTATMRFSGSVESIFSDVDTNIPSGDKANLSVVSPRFSGDKYIWTGRIKDGTGDWGSLSRSTGLTTIFYTPTLTANYRYVIITLSSGGKKLAEIEFMVWFKG
jgi:hypothetical protein